MDCLVLMCGRCGAITILTGEDFELTLATICTAAGVMNFWVSFIEIPASMTLGSLRNSFSFIRTPLLTSALNLYVTSAAICGLSWSVLRAWRDDYLAMKLNSLLPSGNWKTLFIWTFPLGLFSGCWIPMFSIW